MWYHTWHENLPRLKHPHAVSQWETRFRDEILPRCRVWVIETDGLLAGFMALDIPRSHIDQLFIAMRFQRRGLGSLLLTLARRLCPTRLTLHTLVENSKAQRFYEKHGFRPMARGVNPINGQLNIEYAWTPAQPEK
jgi:ribosomal protein S18 acetylase RimI-like enzyme